MTNRVLVFLTVAGMVSCSSPPEGDQDPEARIETPAPDSAALPPSSDTFAADSPEAAQSAVRRYYDDVNARGYAAAYALWASEGAASNQTLGQFGAGFADTKATAADVGMPGRMEGAAGSRFVTLPVAVDAETTRGEPQCFVGTYTLRRSVVDGATAAQMSWRIASANMQKLDAEECAARRTGDDAMQVTAIVEAFGQRLQKVSLLAPAETLNRDLEQQYGPYVDVALLESWLQSPKDAPGREVSSPWPDRIEVVRVTREGAGFRVSGALIYVTSNEARGGEANRVEVTLQVVRDGGWRIAAFEVR